MSSAATMTTHNDTPVYKSIAQALTAYRYVTEQPERFSNPDVARTWLRVLRALEQELPSGSGFDHGTRIDIDASTRECIVLHTAFHHMDEQGCYDGWTEHTVRVRPCFVHDFFLTISGQDRNAIKDYMYDAFSSALHAHTPEAATYGQCQGGEVLTPAEDA